jgi:L-seryl-tRNA(Ser) seleniumtransferase
MSTLPGRMGSSPALPVVEPPAGSRRRAEVGDRRSLPSVESVMQALGLVGLPRPTVLSLVRRELAALRQQSLAPDLETILAQVRSTCDRLGRLRLEPVINGTGVLLHTNLGRAPLGWPVVERLAKIATSFNNLEYDLCEGQRGSRGAYLESSLALLCGAEAASAVNNCAAALVLVLRHFTRQKPEVIISRGELIQIGGGFRIPEILEASGARLHEVGTTNQTSLDDYARAIGPQTALILKVHRSNFVMDGFVASPATRALAELARSKRLLLLEDLGSGAVIRTEQTPGLDHEPTPAEVLRQGVALVTFSGDKLLGGPQAGILAGKAKLVAGLKRDPLFRALRCDKLVLAALEATVELYLQGKPEESIPLWVMMRVSDEELRTRAEQIVWKLRELPLEAQVVSSKARLGGGSLPRSFLPSVAVQLRAPGTSAAKFAQRMRNGSPSVIGCVSGDYFRIDVRTVFPNQDQALAGAIQVAATRTEQLQA